MKTVDTYDDTLLHRTVLSSVGFVADSSKLSFGIDVNLQY